MIVNSIVELSIIGVFDRGVPNQERIVLFVNQTVNLGQYGLMLGIRSHEGTAFPIRDNLFWFGDGLVNQGDWILVYTDPGRATKTNVPNTEQHLFTVHWGRPKTILTNPEFVPILFKVDAVAVGS